MKNKPKRKYTRRKPKGLDAVADLEKSQELHRKTIAGAMTESVESVFPSVAVPDTVVKCVSARVITNLKERGSLLERIAVLDAEISELGNFLKASRPNHGFLFA